LVRTEYSGRKGAKKTCPTETHDAPGALAQWLWSMDEGKVSDVFRSREADQVDLARREFSGGMGAEVRTRSPRREFSSKPADGTYALPELLTRTPGGTRPQ
jgi:hypothetical protein